MNITTNHSTTKTEKMAMDSTLFFLLVALCGISATYTKGIGMLSCDVLDVLIQFDCMYLAYSCCYMYT